MIDLSAHDLQVYDHPAQLKPGDLYFFADRKLLKTKFPGSSEQLLNVNAVLFAETLDFKFVVSVSITTKFNLGNSNKIYHVRSFRQRQNKFTTANYGDFKLDYTVFVVFSNVQPERM